MTATPIPRTAAMLIYGDLDKSELRELPAGRSPITTEVVGPAAPSSGCAVYERVRAEVAAGRQAYVVCPLVEGSRQARGAGGHRGARAPARRGARRPAPRPAARPDAGGRQGGGDAAFRAGETDVLVATTVIEVGRRRPERHGDGDRGRRPLRPAAAPPAARPHRSRRARVVLLPPRRRRRRPRARRAWRRWWSRATASSSPSATSRSAARARCSASGRPGWTDLKLGRLPRDEPIVVEARARRPRRSSTTTPTSRARAAPRRGRGPPRRRGRVPVQELSARRPAARGVHRDGRDGLTDRRGDRGRRAGAGWSRRRAATRPTTDRVKEALFASLGRPRPTMRPCSTSTRGAVRWRSRRCRAARHARCSSTATAPPTAAIRANLDDHRLRRRRPCRARRRCERFLARRPRRQAPFDLVFLDPPYDVPTTEVAAVLGALRAARWLTPGATGRRRAAQGGRTGRRCPTGGGSSWSGPTAIRSWCVATA